MRIWKGTVVKIAGGGRLSLRPLEWSDAEWVLSWVNNEEIVKNFQFFTGKTMWEDEIRYIFKMNDSPHDLLLGIETKEGELIGTCGLHEIDFNNDTARLGVIVGRKDYWNKGYAKVAIDALISWAFSEMNLHKIYLNVFLTNQKSIHLYESLGFLKEGELRGEYKIRGEYVDMLRMAVLRNEWVEPSFQ